MNLKDVYDGIAAVEDAFDVEELTLDGINVWLPLRDIFIRPFYDHRLLTYRELLGTDSHVDPMDAGTAMPTVHPDDVQVTIRPLGGLSLLDTVGTELTVEPDLLFFHAFTDYGDVVGGGCFNRIADSLLEAYGRPDRCLKLVRATPSSLRARFAHPAWQYLEQGGPLQVREPLPGEDALCRHLDAIVDFARGRGFATVYHPMALLNRLRTMVWRSRQFAGLLEHLSPGAVVLSSFSNIERMAMIVAARRVGIPSVDVEHGFMGFLSPYGRLGCVPATGWDVLPDWFWVWGHESARLLELSLGEAAAVHRPVLGGSPEHVRRRLLGIDEHVEVALDEGLRTRVAAAPRTALFCWQPDMLVHEREARLLPSALEDAIVADPETLWLVRLHPRSRHLVPVVEDHLDRLGARNVELRLSTSEPLSALLGAADVVLTSYSTVAFEANERRLPVVLIDEVGVGMMEDYVARGVFDAATDGPALVAAVRARAGQPALPVEYVDPSTDAHERAFRTILQPPPRAADRGAVPHREASA